MIPCLDQHICLVLPNLTIRTWGLQYQLVHIHPFSATAIFANSWIDGSFTSWCGGRRKPPASRGVFGMADSTTNAWVDEIVRVEFWRRPFEVDFGSCFFYVWIGIEVGRFYNHQPFICFQVSIKIRKICFFWIKQPFSYKNFILFLKKKGWTQLTCLPCVFLTFWINTWNHTNFIKPVCEQKGSKGADEKS